MVENPDRKISVSCVKFAYNVKINFVRHEPEPVRKKQIRRLESKQTNFYLEYTPVILSDRKARYLEQEAISTSEKKLQWL
jgi:hypothetical protein